MQYQLNQIDRFDMALLQHIHPECLMPMCIKKDAEKTWVIFDESDAIAIKNLDKLSEEQIIELLQNLVNMHYALTQYLLSINKVQLSLDAIFLTTEGFKWCYVPESILPEKIKLNTFIYTLLTSNNVELKSSVLLPLYKWFDQSVDIEKIENFIQTIHSSHRKNLNEQDILKADSRIETNKHLLQTTFSADYLDENVPSNSGNELIQFNQNVNTAMVQEDHPLSWNSKMMHLNTKFNQVDWDINTELDSADTDERNDKNNQFSKTLKKQWRRFMHYLTGTHTDNSFDVRKYSETVKLSEIDENENRLLLIDQTTKKSIALNNLKGTIIGSYEGNALNLSPEQGVSNHHAKIFQVGDAFVLSDLNSTNGTRLNDSDMISGGFVILKSGDVITVGEKSFQFQVKTGDW